MPKYRYTVTCHSQDGDILAWDVVKQYQFFPPDAVVLVESSIPKETTDVVVTCTEFDAMQPLWVVAIEWEHSIG
jgi:hypothetical protein